MDKKTSHSIDKQTFDAFCDFLSEIIIDPLFFAFAVLMLFSRIQAIIEFTAANPTFSFWAILELDMEMHLGLYIGFIAAFAIWSLLKGYKYRREKAEGKQLTNTLEKINTNIAGLQEVIRDLQDKIAESIKPSEDADNKPKGVSIQ